MAEERYDSLLGMILNESGGFNGLMEGFFGFLRRRTDFYAYALPGDRMGFPPGMAEQLVFSYYMKYRQVYNEKHPPPPGIELPYRQVTEEEAEQMRKEGKLPPKKETSPTTEETKETVVSEPVAPDATAVPKEETWVEPPAPSDPSISTTGGAVTDKYKWSQDISDVQVQIDLPPGTRAKDMLVKVEIKKIKVALKAKPTEPILEGELFEKVKPDKCLWQMDRNSIILNLEKNAAVVWKSVLLNEVEGDVKASVD